MGSWSMHGPGGFGPRLGTGGGVCVVVVARPVGGPVNGAASLPEKSTHPASNAAAVATTTA
ncbi:hypothetical protein MTP03_33400 [Tsukamurella sp. PLM1]|nr:hypothetical protein MTP03_33400 [Tsukamurella sp. PLM1]